MAKLPSRLDLSGPVSLRSGRGIAVADTSAIGRGLASFGQSVEQVGSDIQQQRNAVDLARAEAYKTQQFMAVENDFANDPDYATAGNRAGERTRGVVGDAANLIRDPSMRERWQIAAGTDAARVNDAVIDRGVALQRQAETVAFDEALEANRRIYVDPNTSEELKTKARADIEGAIAIGQQSGLLTPGDAESRTKEFIEAADYSRGLLAVENGQFDGSVPEVPNTGAVSTDAAALLRTFEGFRETPYWDVNANRVGYGSDTITRADGSVVRVQAGMAVSREDAERDLSRRTAEFEGVALRQVGPEAWNALPPNARAALVSTTYNYGSLPGSVVAAAKTGDVTAIASAVRGLSGHNGGVNADRRAKEAAIIEGKGNPDWYKRLSPEQQQVMNERAATRAQAVASANAAQQKIAYETHKESLGLGILTGAVVSEQELLSDPILQDGDKATLLRSLRAEQSATFDARQFLGGLVDGTAPALNPFNTDDQALAEKSYEMLSDAIPEEQKGIASAQFIQQTGMIPGPVVAEVRQGLASTDPVAVAGALQSAANLQTVAPMALGTVTNGESIRKAADLYSTYTGMGYSPAEASQKYIASNDPQAVAQREALLKSKPVADMLKNVSDRDVSAIFPALPFMGARVGDNPAQSAAMVSEYRGLLEEAIVDANGDQDAAKELAATRFQRVYGTSDLVIGGGSTITRLPPEKTYPAAPDGSHGYIRTQLEDALKQEGVAFDDVRLVPYDETEADFRSGEPARYQVSYLADGQWQLFNLPFVADPAAAIETFNADRRIQLDDARARQQRNVTEEMVGVEASQNQPPAAEMDQLSQDAWMEQNGALGRLLQSEGAQ